MDLRNYVRIGDTVEFTPNVKHINEHLITSEKRTGVVTSIRFTKAKTFYYILDDVFGIVFEEIDGMGVISDKKVSK